MEGSVVAPIERWMAMRKARATKVKRALFAPITAEDRNRTAKHIADMKALLATDAKRTYNFDFDEERPLEGRYHWEIAVAPMPYTARLPATTCRVIGTQRCRESSCAMELDLSSPTRPTENCDTIVDNTPIHDSGVFTDSSDEENTNATTSSPTPTASSSPRLSSMCRKRTIPGKPLASSSYTAVTNFLYDAKIPRTDSCILLRSASVLSSTKHPLSLSTGKQIRPFKFKTPNPSTDAGS